MSAKCEALMLHTIFLSYQVLLNTFIVVASETYLSWYQPYVVEKVDISCKVQCRFVFMSTITVALTERAEVNQRQADWLSKETWLTLFCCYWR